MAKRRTLQEKARAEMKAKRKAAIEAAHKAEMSGTKKPGKHPSKYGAKNRPREIGRGYSSRPTSPFYLPESQVTE